MLYAVTRDITTARVSREPQCILIVQRYKQTNRSIETGVYDTYDSAFIL